MSPPESKEGPWYILARVPAVVVDDDGDVSPGKDLGFLLRRAPRVSVLRLPRRLAPEGTSDIDHPYVAAADESGDLLLLCSRRHSDMSEYLVWLSTNPGEEEVFLPSARPGVPIPDCYYFVCDTTDEKAARLPNCPDSYTPDPGCIGLIRRGGESMVVELHGDTVTKLLCYTAATGLWSFKEAMIDSEIPGRWGRNGAFCHGGRLWWVDLCVGLYTCDPFEERPLMSHIPLPNDCKLPEGLSNGTRMPSAVHELFKTRRVSVSGGDVRYCQIDKGVISVWRMHDPPVGSKWVLGQPEEGANPWTQEHRIPLTVIWSDDMYRSAGMKKCTPVVALMHPWDPNMAFFSESSTVFSVDLRAMKVLSSKSMCLAEVPPPEFPSSDFFMAWQLPPPPPQGIIGRLSKMASPPILFSVGLSLSLILSNRR